MKEWDLGLGALILLAGSLNFGFFIGSIFCVFMVDNAGRRNMIILGSAIQVACFFISN